MVVPFQITRTQSKSSYRVEHSFMASVKRAYTALHDAERNHYSFSHSPCLSPVKFSQRDHLLTRNGITNSFAVMTFRAAEYALKTRSSRGHTPSHLKRGLQPHGQYLDYHLPLSHRLCHRFLLNQRHKAHCQSSLTP